MNEKVISVINMETQNESEKCVIMDKENQIAYCTCHMFEFEGVLCRRVLLVLQQVGIGKVPQQYIRERWSKHIGNKSELDRSRVDIGTMCSGSLVARHNYMTCTATSIIDDACKLEETSQYVIDMFTEVHLKVQDMVLSSNGGTLTRDEKREEKMPIDDAHYHAPTHVVTKGQGKRLKSSKEKAMSKAHLCRGCNKRGVSHGKQNCPKFLKRYIGFYMFNFNSSRY